MTEFSRTQNIPVLGIIESGVDLFCEALRADPLGSIIIFGTRTTIDSCVHRDQLVTMGIANGRIAGTACHGLAAAIERDPESPAVTGLIEKCVAEACKKEMPGSRLYAGLACTHYTYVKESIRVTIERRSGRQTTVLDPNQRMVNSIAPRSESALLNPAAGAILVQVISKVELGDAQRRALAARLEPVSDVTARALLNYTHDPGLF
jgi:glutamate racemase